MSDKKDFSHKVVNGICDVLDKNIPWGKVIFIGWLIVALLVYWYDKVKDEKRKEAARRYLEAHPPKYHTCFLCGHRKEEWDMSTVRIRGKDQWVCDNCRDKFQYDE